MHVIVYTLEKNNSFKVFKRKFFFKNNKEIFWIFWRKNVKCFIATQCAARHVFQFETICFFFFFLFFLQKMKSLNFIFCIFFLPPFFSRRFTSDCWLDVSIWTFQTGHNLNLNHKQEKEIFFVFLIRCRKLSISFSLLRIVNKC
jgi:hypothetical protein